MPVPPALQNNPAPTTAPIVPPQNYGPASQLGGLEGIMPPAAGGSLIERLRRGGGVEKGADESRGLDMAEAAISGLSRIIDFVSRFFERKEPEE